MGKLPTQIYPALIINEFALNSRGTRRQEGRSPYDCGVARVNETEVRTHTTGDKENQKLKFKVQNHRGISVEC